MVHSPAKKVSAEVLHYTKGSLNTAEWVCNVVMTICMTHNGAYSKKMHQNATLSLIFGRDGSRVVHESWFDSCTI